MCGLWFSESNLLLLALLNICVRVSDVVVVIVVIVVVVVDGCVKNKIGDAHLK